MDMFNVYVASCFSKIKIKSSKDLRFSHNPCVSKSIRQSINGLAVRCLNFRLIRINCNFLTNQNNESVHTT